MDIDKTDIEWLIMLMVTMWPYISKALNTKRKAQPKRKRGKRKR